MVLQVAHKESREVGVVAPVAWPVETLERPLRLAVHNEELPRLVRRARALGLGRPLGDLHGDGTEAADHVEGAVDDAEPALPNPVAIQPTPLFCLRVIRIGERVHLGVQIRHVRAIWVLDGQLLPVLVLLALLGPAARRGGAEGHQQLGAVGQRSELVAAQLLPLCPRSVAHPRAVGGRVARAQVVAEAARVWKQLQVMP
mmetsp:Transcript_31710/g.64142  ORF Transcript_31710/g.64142 Transcript_31710/m.64142 type:complete len:200 (-) Transcript_31710:36-635(-)